MSESKAAPPRVVALTPTWNAEGLIEATLESLASQTYPHFETVISDDASTDSTPAICERFVRSDRRFRLIRRDTNVGWVRNTSSLLDAADGDYFFFAYQDDLFQPDFVERLAARLSANRNASIAFSDLDTIDPEGRRRTLSYSALADTSDRLERARRLIRRDQNWWLPVHGLFRASAARRTGGLKRHLGGEFSADWPWLVRMALEGEIESVPHPLLTKTLRRGSVADGWSFAPRYWYAAALSCAQEVLRSPITLREKISLWRLLVRFCFERRRESREWVRRRS